MVVINLFKEVSKRAQAGNADAAALLKRLYKTSFPHSKTIYHKTFGEGVINRLDGAFLRVTFQNGAKKTFLYPDAFIDGHLKVKAGA